MEHWSADDYLTHHGILGQRWGKKNGPPYPLGAGDHSAEEKKAGWRQSLQENAAAAKRRRERRKEDIRERKIMDRTPKRPYPDSWHDKQSEIDKMNGAIKTRGLEALKYKKYKKIRDEDADYLERNVYSKIPEKYREDYKKYYDALEESIKLSGEYSDRLYEWGRLRSKQESNMIEGFPRDPEIDRKIKEQEEKYKDYFEKHKELENVMNKYRPPDDIIYKLVDERAFKNEDRESDYVLRTDHHRKIDSAYEKNKELAKAKAKEFDEKGETSKANVMRYMADKNEKDKEAILTDLTKYGDEYLYKYERIRDFEKEDNKHVIFGGKKWLQENSTHMTTPLARLSEANIQKGMRRAAELISEEEFAKMTPEEGYNYLRKR